jgi:hypothetical protein
MTIEQVDEKLSILRESWLDSAQEKKASWMSKINKALDERLVLMKERPVKPKRVRKPKQD